MDLERLFKRIDYLSSKLGKPGYETWLRQSFESGHQPPQESDLVAEIEYMHQRHQYNKELRQFYDSGKTLPKGCFKGRNGGYYAYYYDSRTLNRRWNPTQPPNGGKDSENYKAFMEGLHDARNLKDK